VSQKNTQEQEKKIQNWKRKGYGNVKKAKIYSYARYETYNAAKQKSDWTHKLVFYLQNGRLRDNKWRLFQCYEKSNFTSKRIKLTEFHPKNDGNKFKWKRRKFRLG